MILTFIAVLLLVWSVYSITTGLEILKQEWLAASIFIVLAVVLELSAIKLEKGIYTSIGFCAYLVLFIKFDYTVAVLAASIGLFLRVLTINKERLVNRFYDFSVHLISVALSGAVFSVINGVSAFMSPPNIAAILAASAFYFFLDYFLRYSTARLHNDEALANFKSSWKKTIAPMISLIPLGMLIVMTYNQNPLFSLITIIPLIAIHQSVKFGIREIVIANQEQLVGAINELQESLKKHKNQNRELTIDLNKRVEEQDILMEMGNALGTSVNINETLEIVVDRVRQLAPYQSCVIFLLEKKEGGGDDEKELIARKAVTPYKDVLAISSLLDLQEDFVQLVVQNKKPIFIPDIPSTNEQRIFKGEKSLICVPLIVKNEIIGVIYVGATQPGTYNEDHQRLLTILGNAASNAIKSAQLYEQTQNSLKETESVNRRLEVQLNNFERLLEIGQKLTSSLNLDEALKTIFIGLEKMFDYESAAVFLIEKTPKGVKLVPKDFRSPYKAFFERYKVPVTDQDNILGWICHSRLPLLLEDSRTHKLKTVISEERSVMAHHMVVENEVIGAIYVGHSRPGYFDEGDLNLLKAVAQTAASTIKNAVIHEQTKIQAITDGLTGLYTHRFFQERLDEEIRFARRKKIGLALVMVDADHFKSYNDTLGHPEGDKVLKTIAHLMKKHTRDSDIVCRIGGDEFTVLLKEIDKANALSKAEAIRGAVEVEFRDHKVQITTSIGLACFPEDAQTKKDLIASADAALYTSKKRGRNKVSVAEGPVAEFVKEPLPRD